MAKQYQVYKHTYSLNQWTKRNSFRNSSKFLRWCLAHQSAASCRTFSTARSVSSFSAASTPAPEDVRSQTWLAENLSVSRRQMLWRRARPETAAGDRSRVGRGTCPEVVQRGPRTARHWCRTHVDVGPDSWSSSGQPLAHRASNRRSHVLAS